MKKYRANIKAADLELPVDIVLERRRDIRFGITGRRVSLRMPLGSGPEEIRTQLAKLENWTHEQLLLKPALRTPFIGKTYNTGDVLTVGKRQYILEVNLQDRATHAAQLIGNTISLKLSTQSSPEFLNKSIKTLLSRVVAGDFHPEIARRVLDWNDRTFRQPIKSINLKYNHSNWGSCSSHSNVNLSTRLLFAPDDVQDYVIVHELAHLLEFNHSDRFWALVEAHMPDYPLKEKWLKINRAKCDF